MITARTQLLIYYDLSFIILQKQVMRNDLEQVAKQQDVEREMKVLTKHQTKLQDLKSAVAKVTARFNAQYTEDNTSNTETLQLASSLSDIEQKLAVQVYHSIWISTLTFHFSRNQIVVVIKPESGFLKN